MNYKDAMGFLNGREHKKWHHNTYLRKDGDDVVCKFHDTDILRWKKNGGVVMDSGGWMTFTTKERFNALVTGIRIWQSRRIWYVAKVRVWNPETESFTEAPEPVVFKDGMTFNTKTGKFRGVGPGPKVLQAKLKRVRAYASGYIKALFAGRVPAPSAGDCFYCCMQVADGKDKGRPLGEVSGSDHLESHMTEKYYVPSLLHNAIRASRGGQLPPAMNDVLAVLWNPGCATGEQRSATLRVYGGLAARELERRLVNYMCRGLGLASA